MNQNKTTKQVEELLFRECRGLSSSCTIRHLFALGLISENRCNAYLARRMVAELTANGETKMMAIEKTAVQLGRSYATISNYIYYNFKN